MFRLSATRIRAAFALALAAAALAGCSANHGRMPLARVKLSERECLARAMYFESNRSSDAGMLAVGTVVMNRVRSGKYGATVCEVVGAPRQFAPGVLTRSMSDSGAPRARRIADQVLAGRRHPGVQNAHFFHTAGYRFPYRNMRYVLVAGGNAFYDKQKPPKTWWGGEGRWGAPPAPTEHIDGGPIMVAKVEVEDDAGAAPVRGASRRVAETHVAEARAAVAAPPRSGSYDGIPVYEPAPGARAPRETVVASLEPSRRPRSDFDEAPRRRAETIAEDNGLRVEDRWRDQELAEDEGRKPAESGQDWAARRSDRIEQAALPEIETPRPRGQRVTRVAARAPEVYDAAPEPRPAMNEPAPSRNARPAARAERPTRVAMRGPEAYDAAPEPRAVMDEPAPSHNARPAARTERPTRVAARDPKVYDAASPVAEEPAPSRSVRVASRAPRTVETRSRPVEADPAAMGWNVGAQPVRDERAGPAMDGYRPLSAAAGDAGYQVDAPRRPARQSRSYGGVALHDGDSIGFR